LPGNKCGTTKEECPPFHLGLPRRFTPRNDGGMDSCFRRNDPGKARLYGAGIKGSGNDIRDTE